MKSRGRTGFTTLMLPFTTETRTSVTFYCRRVGRVKFATRFTSIRLVKQEALCGT